LAAAVALGAAGIAVAVVPGSAGAATAATIGLTQTAPHAQIGKGDVLTATVRVGGSLAPENTPVQLHPAGGLIVDHLYTAVAAQPAGGTGYWMAAATGSVRTFSGATGSTPVLAGISTTLNDPVVGMVPTSTGAGFWLVQSSGKVTARGDAAFYGDTSNVSLNAPIVGMAASPDNSTYWLLAADGSIFTYGAAGSSGATYFGSPGQQIGSSNSAASIVSTATGKGYWVVTYDGTVYSYGDATASTVGNFAVPTGDFLDDAARSGTGLIAVTDAGRILATGGATSEGDVPDANAPVLGLASTPSGKGYFAAGEDGQILTQGDAAFAGDAWTAYTRSGQASLTIQGIVPGDTQTYATSLAGTSSTVFTHWSEPPGYWMVASDGGIFTFGDAGYHGSTGSIHLAQPVVGMAPTPDGGGYWLVAADGGIFTFGDASYFGSTGNLHLNKPIVGIAATPDGGGYWLVASDGGIFTFGDASYFGSTGNVALHKPIVGMAASPDGGGYTLVASDGGIFTFGDAQFHGSTGNVALNKPIVGMAPTPLEDGGYWLVASDGGIFTFGDAVFAGSTGNVALNKPIVGMAADPGVGNSLNVLASSARSDGYTVPTRFNDSYRFRQWLENRARG
jgi:hypothetical protein